MSSRSCIGPFAVVAVLASLQARPAAAGLLHVPEEHATIAAALAAASSGDTVSIAPGTYYEHDLLWPPGVAILGRARSPDATVIEGQLMGRILAGENLTSESVLAGLTLRGGRPASGGYGGGVMVRGDAMLIDLIIEDCTMDHGGYGIGLYVWGGATIERCVVRNNQSSTSSTFGGGAWLEDRGPAHPLTVRDLEAYNNRAAVGGGIYVNGYHGYYEGLLVHDNVGGGMGIVNGEVDGDGPVVENSLFMNHTGPGVAFDAGVTLRNCTIVGNGTAGGWAGAVHSASTWDHPMHPRITQCVIAFNRGPGITWEAPTPFTIDCNDVFGNEGGNYYWLPDLTGQDGNLSLDPEFCGGEVGNFGLQSDSPCAPDQNDCGLLIGALPVNCETTGVADTSWGAVKALY